MTDYYPLSIIYSHLPLDNIEKELTQIQENLSVGQFKLLQILPEKNNLRQHSNRTLALITNEFWRECLRLELNLDPTQRKKPSIKSIRILPFYLSNYHIPTSRRVNISFNGDLFLKLPDNSRMNENDIKTVVAKIIEQANNFGLLKELSYELILPRKNIDRMTGHLKNNFFILFADKTSTEDKILVKTLFNYYNLALIYPEMKDQNKLILASWKRHYRQVKIQQREKLPSND